MIRLKTMIFLDASYLISLVVDEHENHEKAEEIFNNYIWDKEKIISKLVISEVITVLDKNLNANHDLLKKTYIYLNNDFAIVEDSIFFDDAMQQVLKYKRLGFFDSMYIAIMEILQIKEIASFDKDFDKIKGIIRIH
jgi:predicted nucleic acid-binding protein